MHIEIEIGGEANQRKHNKQKRCLLLLDLLDNRLHRPQGWG